MSRIVGLIVEDSSGTRDAAPLPDGPVVIEDGEVIPVKKGMPVTDSKTWRAADCWVRRDDG